MLILFTLPEARFMMAHAHDYTQLICELRICESRSVFREDLRPHRRPQIVALKS